MNSGFLLIDKLARPADAEHGVRGYTSHDVVNQLRRITGIKKIGHAGTLDPFASGLLIVAVEREATRRLSEFVGLDKTYEAVLQLGATSDTYDRDGKIQNSNSKTQINFNNQTTKENIEETLSLFVGEQEQIPPMFSAKKVKGKKLYELARKGVEIERRPSKITIYDLRITNYDTNSRQLSVVCRVSSGTYIRTLGHDIGQKLLSTGLKTGGCGAYVQELRRTAIGEYSVADAVKMEDITSENWQEHLKDLV